MRRRHTWAWRRIEGVEERREEEEEDIPEHEGEEKELRREEKKKKKKKKGDGSVVKLGILGFLFGRLPTVLPMDN
jgi:hypothetical protein